MKRTIKFRAWDKSRLLFHYPELWGNTMPSNWEYHYILHQFTGLKDKNGVEIYEGDIVCVFDENKDPYFYHTVIFHFGAFGYDCMQNEEDMDFNFIDFSTNQYFNWDKNCKSKEIEVLGNIYEHPELLTTAQP